MSRSRSSESSRCSRRVLSAEAGAISEADGSMRIAAVGLVAMFAASVFSVPAAEAHPGGTDGNGCHTCRTNCPRWGISYGYYHRHYPVRDCFPPVQTTPRAPSPTRTPVPVATYRPAPVFPTLPPPQFTPTTRTQEPDDNTATLVIGGLIAVVVIVWILRRQDE